MDSDASERALLTASLVRATPVSVTFMSLMAESLSFVDSTLVPRALWGQNVIDVRKYLTPVNIHSFCRPLNTKEYVI